MAAELVTGREAAIPFSLSAGVPSAWIAAASLLQNLGLAAVVVPLVLDGAEVAMRGDSWLSRTLVRLRQSAKTQHHRGGGGWAVFGFMLIPFLANGPIIAGLVGRIAGLSWRVLIPAVVAGVLVTAVGWSFGYAALAAALAAVDPRLAALPTIAAVGFVLYATVKIFLRTRPAAT